MPSVTINVSSDLLLWAGTQALENSDAPRGECLLKDYYKKDLPSPPKKKSIRTRLATKIRSWTHCTSLFSHSTSASTSCTNLSDLSSTLIGSDSTQPKFLAIEPTSSSVFYPYDNSLLVSSDSPANVILADNSCSSTPPVMASKSDNASSSTPSDTSSSSNAPVPTPSPFYSFTLPMPQPGVPGSPWFDGTNVTEFLDRYSNMCRDYHVSEKEMVRRMLWYCDSIVAQNIRSLTAYQDQDWEPLAKAMKEEYAEGDEIQVMYSVEYLERLKSLDRSENDDLDLYCQQYRAISSELISKGHFDERTQCRWFLQGLPRMVRQELYFRFDTKVDGRKKLSFPDIYTNVQVILGARRGLTEIMAPTTRNPRLSTLLERSTRKAPDPTVYSLPPPLDFFSYDCHLPSASNPSKPSPSTVASPQQLPVDLSKSRRDEELAKVNDKMDWISEKMEHLILSMQATPSTSAAPISVPCAQPFTPLQNPIIPNTFAQTQPGSTRPSSFGKRTAGMPNTDQFCHYCWSTDHVYRRQCKACQDDLDVGRIHLTPEGKIGIGKYSSGAVRT